MTFRQWKILDRVVFWTVSSVLLFLTLFVVAPYLEKRIESKFLVFVLFFGTYTGFLMMGSLVGNIMWRFRPDKKY